MKKIIKNPIFTFIIGAIIFGSIGSVVAFNYNAKQIDYSPKDTDWNVSTVEGAINDLKEQSGNSFNPVLLWTNPNPTQDFGAQTISLDLSNYKYVIVVTKALTTVDGKPRSTAIVPVGNNISAPSVGATNNRQSRNMRVTTTGIEFYVAYWGGEIGNDAAIPYKIYGVTSDIDIDFGI